MGMAFNFKLQSIFLFVLFLSFIPTDFLPNIPSIIEQGIEIFILMIYSAVFV